MPPPRYTEASLVKKLEELGIGRPSTYASIMNSIKRREYAAIQNRQFDPSDRGRVVVSFLDDYFSEYFQYDFTAKMEESLDLIARGELDWKNLLDNFWSGLEPNLVKVEGLSNREVLDSLNESLSKQLFRENSNCPKCNEGNLTLKNSAKFGPFVGCSRFDEDGCDFKRNPFLSKEQENINALNTDSLGKDPSTGSDVFIKPSTRGGGFYLSMESQEATKRQTFPADMLESITLDEALKWLELPREIGMHPDGGPLREAG